MSEDIAIHERLARLEAKISVLGWIATGALAVNCTFLGAVLTLLVTGR